VHIVLLKKNFPLFGFYVNNEYLFKRYSQYFTILNNANLPKTRGEYRAFDGLSIKAEKETERMFCAPTLNKTAFAIRPDKSPPNEISIRETNLARWVSRNSMKEGRKDRRNRRAGKRAGRSRERRGIELLRENLSIFGIYASLGTDSEEPRESTRDCAIDVKQTSTPKTNHHRSPPTLSFAHADTR